MGRRTENPANAVILMSDVQHSPAFLGETTPGLAQSARKTVSPSCNFRYMFFLNTIEAIIINLYQVSALQYTTGGLGYQPP